MLNENIPKFKALALFLKTTELLTTGQKANYARGLMVDDYMGYKTYSHSGFGFGGQTQLITIPEQNISIVILTNLQSINPTPISYKVIDLIGLNTKKKTLKLQVNLCRLSLKNSIRLLATTRK
jgi:hypothetical protein